MTGGAGGWRWSGGSGRRVARPPGWPGKGRNGERTATGRASSGRAGPFLRGRAGRSFFAFSGVSRPGRRVAGRPGPRFGGWRLVVGGRWVGGRVGRRGWVCCVCVAVGAVDVVVSGCVVGSLGGGGFFLGFAGFGVGWVGRWVGLRCCVVSCRVCGCGCGCVAAAAASRSMRWFLGAWLVRWGVVVFLGSGSGGLGRRRWAAGRRGEWRVVAGWWLGVGWLA